VEDDGDLCATASMRRRDWRGLPSLVVFACLQPMTRCVVKLMSPRKIAVPEETSLSRLQVYALSPARPAAAAPRATLSSSAGSFESLLNELCRKAIV
jgi:hypothetical protein